MISKALERAHEIAARFRVGVPDLLAAKKTDDVGELFIYAPIGDSWWTEGVTAKQVVEKLDSLKGVKTLRVRINSEGGSVWDGKAIENAIRRFECDDKVAHIDGLAASAATFIAMACPRIVSAANATWMIHEAAWFAAGRASDLRAVADVLEKENRTIAETYAAKTGKSADECLSLMASETWMTASEAHEHGFTDEVEKREGEDEKKAAARSPLKLVAALRETEVRAASPRTTADLARARARELSEKFPGQPGATARSGQPGQATNAATPVARLKG